MFHFRKKETKSLLIMANDVMRIIKSDFENDMAFTLIEFLYHGKQYTMGSCVLSEDAEETKENISFVFQDKVFQNFEEFESSVYIENINISQLTEPIEIVRAGIIGKDAALKTPWGEKRLAEKAVNR